MLFKSKVSSTWRKSSIFLFVDSFFPGKYCKDKGYQTKKEVKFVGKIDIQNLRRRRFVHLRGHHLICLHFYHGEGYDQHFIDNLSGLMERARAGEPVEVVSGPDNVCRCCPNLVENICAHRKDSEAGIQKLDKKALGYLELNPGEIIFWSDLKQKVKNAPEEWFKDFCRRCDWLAVCEKTYLMRQKGTRLQVNSSLS